MALDERSRHELFLKLEQVLGPDEAATLMEHLPPLGWGEVATRRDLEQHAALTKRDLEQHAAMTRSDLEQHEANTRRDLEQHEANTKREFEHVRLEMREMEARLTANFRGELIAQTRTMMLAMTGMVFSVGGLAFAAARLA